MKNTWINLCGVNKGQGVLANNSAKRALAKSSASKGQPAIIDSFKLTPKIPMRFGRLI